MKRLVALVLPFLLVGCPGEKIQIIDPNGARLPAAPRILQIIPKNKSVSIQWTRPDQDNELTALVVSWSPGNGLKTIESPSASVDIGDLGNGTAYTFQLNVSNSAGLGPPSLPFGPVIPSTAPAVPSAPTGVRVGTESGGATIRFTAPSDAGNSPISKYLIRSVDDAYVAEIDAPKSATVSSVLPLFPVGKAIQLKVQAVNSTGTGPRSLASNRYVLRQSLPCNSAAYSEVLGTAVRHLPISAAILERRTGGPLLLSSSIDADDRALDILPFDLRLGTTLNGGVGNGGRTSIALGDYNGDGIADAAVGHASEGRISVWQGVAPGEFAINPIALTIPGGQIPRQVILVDLTGDGFDDVVAYAGPDCRVPEQCVSGQPSGQIEFFASSGAAFLKLNALQVGWVGALRSTDVDGDGAKELAVLHQLTPSTGQGSLFRMNQGALQAAFTTPILSGKMRDALAADIDGDAADELVLLTDESSGQVLQSRLRVYRSAAGGLTETWTAQTAFGSGLLAHDGNRDGPFDVLLTRPGSSHALYVASGSATLSGPRVVQWPSPPLVTGHADVDGDGADDLIGLIDGANVGEVQTVVLKNTCAP